MNRSEDAIAVSCTDITILDEEVLGILGKVGLWVSEPSEVRAIELDAFRCNGECIVL